MTCRNERCPALGIFLIAHLEVYCFGHRPSSCPLVLNKLTATWCLGVEIVDSRTAIEGHLDRLEDRRLDSHVGTISNVAQLALSKPCREDSFFEKLSRKQVCRFAAKFAVRYQLKFPDNKQVLRKSRPNQKRKDKLHVTLEFFLIPGIGGFASCQR